MANEQLGEAQATANPSLLERMPPFASYLLATSGVIGIITSEEVLIGGPTATALTVTESLAALAAGITFGVKAQKAANRANRLRALAGPRQQR